MKMLCTAVFSLFALTAPTFAQEPSNAERLVNLVFATGALEAAKAAFAPFLEQARKQGIPPAGIKEISTAADAFFNKTFSDPDLLKEVVKLYEDTFTADELQAIVSFYDTPVGRKTLATLPQVTQQAGQLGQKYAAKNQEGFQEELRGIFERYQKAPKAPAEDKADGKDAAKPDPKPAKK